MIKKIGTSIKNLSTKILILLIALSFAVWGIGDIFTGNSNPTIAEVGNSKIKLNDFNLEYQTVINNLRQNNSQPLPEDFIKSLGIHTSILNNMINNEYINILSKDLGIVASRETVKKNILRNKNFHDQLGVFNKDYFNYFLNRNNISEQELLAISRKKLVNNILIKTIGSNTNVSNVIAENIEKKRDLVRKAEIYEINTTSMIVKSNITDQDITNHYNEIKSGLLSPEKRNINIIFINKNNIKNDFSVEDAELLNIYKANNNVYNIPEEKVLQFIF